MLPFFSPACHRPGFIQGWVLPGMTVSSGSFRFRKLWIFCFGFCTQSAPKKASSWIFKARRCKSGWNHRITQDGLTKNPLSLLVVIGWMTFLQNPKSVFDRWVNIIPHHTWSTFRWMKSNSPTVSRLPCKENILDTCTKQTHPSWKFTSPQYNTTLSHPSHLLFILFCAGKNNCDTRFHASRFLIAGQPWEYLLIDTCYNFFIYFFSFP